MNHPTRFLGFLTAAAFWAAACGTNSEGTGTPAGEEVPRAAAPAPSAEVAVPTAPDAIRGEVKATLSEARAAVDRKALADLHAHAARLWSLAAGLRTAKVPYGRLFRLARDLDTQGDAANVAGANEVLAAIEREVVQPSADQPDEGAPLTAHAHQYACPMDCEKGKVYDKPGACPVCEMDLEPVVAGAFAHARHSPQHGGQFIMAEDNWHHVEGTLPTAKEFKLRLYDNFSMPTSAVGVTATLRVTVKHRNRKEGTAPEFTTLEMTPGPEGTTLVAPIPDGAPWPIATRSVVTFPGKQPFTFDFQFDAVSVEPPPGSHGADDLRPIPTEKAEILAALDESVSTAKEKAEGGKLPELHAVAARIAKLAAALATSGGSPLRLARLASDLHEQGDGGNKAGALEVIAEIAKDVAAARK